MADAIAKSTANVLVKYSCNKILYSDYIPHWQNVLRFSWRSQWMAHTSLAGWYKSISPSTSRILWFLNLNLDWRYVVAFTRLILGHNSLPAHAYLLNLNSFCLACFIKCL